MTERTEAALGYAASLDSIKAAAAVIEPYAIKTPVLDSSVLDDLARCKLFFKCEMFQKGGAFKFRGACNAVFSLSDEEAHKGVVTHSSGNHAAALALAALQRGIPAYIAMPSTAPQCKVENTKRYKGNITFTERAVAAREAACEALIQQTGAVFIPPYNYGPVMSGQGTVGLEFMEQVPSLDAVVVPVSGGGLLSGVAIAVKSVNPLIKVFAAEPLGSNGAADAAASKAAGALIRDMGTPDTIADGLQAQLGCLTWPVVRDLVDAVITLTDEEIMQAMALLWGHLKVVVEPSGAIGLAAVLAPKLQEQWPELPTLGRAPCVGIVLSGGNVDLGQAMKWCLKATKPALDPEQQEQLI